MMSKLSTLLLIGVVACGTVNGPNPPGIEFSVNAPAYATGDTIRLTLANRSLSQLGYNLCGVALEYRTNTGWQPAAPRHLPYAACTLELRVLQPGGTAVALQVVQPQIPSGVYRFRTGIEWPLDSQDHPTLTTGQFDITAP